MNISRLHLSEIIKHCQEEYPKEACGILVGITESSEHLSSCSIQDTAGSNAEVETCNNRKNRMHSSTIGKIPMKERNANNRFLSSKKTDKNLMAEPLKLICENFNQQGIMNTERQTTNYELKTADFECSNRCAWVKKIYKMKNISEVPESCYFMSPEEQFKVFKEIRGENLELVAIYHSHTNSPAYPSKRDVELAFYPEVVYLIISMINFNEPEIRGFKIQQEINKIDEVTIKVKD